MEGQGLLTILDGTSPKPIIPKPTSNKDKVSVGTSAKSANEKELTTRRQNNATVITWILNSTNPSISVLTSLYYGFRYVELLEKVVSPDQ